MSYVIPRNVIQAMEIIIQFEQLKQKQYCISPGFTKDLQNMKDMNSDQDLKWRSLNKDVHILIQN